LKKGLDGRTFKSESKSKSIAFKSKSKSKSSKNGLKSGLEYYKSGTNSKSEFDFLQRIWLRPVLRTSVFAALKQHVMLTRDRVFEMSA